MEGSCSTGQSPQWAVVPVEEEEYTLEIIYKKDGLRRRYNVQVLYDASVYTVKLEGTVN
jgi:hypothetical protein